VPLFNKLVFKEILLPKVLAGGEQADFVVKFSQASLEHLLDCGAEGEEKWAQTLRCYRGVASVGGDAGTGPT